jgi:hypothetical protein
MAKLGRLEGAKLKEFLELVDEFERAKEALREFIDEEYTDADEAFENRSEKWKESDEGEAAQERVNAMQQFRDDMECIETPEYDVFAERD